MGVGAASSMGSRGLVAQGAVRPERVVLVAPVGDHGAGLQQAAVRWGFEAAPAPEMALPADLGTTVRPDACPYTLTRGG